MEHLELYLQLFRSNTPYLKQSWQIFYNTHKWISNWWLITFSQWTHLRRVFWNIVWFYWMVRSYSNYINAALPLPSCWTIYTKKNPQKCVALLLSLVLSHSVILSFSICVLNALNSHAITKPSNFIQSIWSDMDSDKWSLISNYTKTRKIITFHVHFYSTPIRNVHRRFAFELLMFTTTLRTRHKIEK